METPKHYDSSHAAAFQAGHKAGEEAGFWTGYNEACKDFKIGEYANIVEEGETDGEKA